MLGWVGNCLQNMQSDWIFDFLFQGAFLYINFLFIFPVPRQTVAFYMSSLLYQYFDPSKTVYLKLERAVQHCPLVLLLKSVQHTGG